MSSTGNHLLVFGASGVSGWACVNEALSYPTKSTFEKVTGLTNRPLSLEDSNLPKDSRLQLVSGVDLTASVDNVVASMKQKISGIDTVTHVIFTAYIEKPDYDSLRTVNTNLLQTAIGAVDQLASKLQSVVLQTGGKAYGVEFKDKVDFHPPLKESSSRIPKPWYDNIFYYTQYDTLKDLSASRPWTFSEIRPDVIVGFTPGTNFMNCAQGLGLWLSLAREVQGAGAKIPFPGTKASYTNKHTDTFQDVLGKMDIYAAVNHDKCGNGNTFNCADGAVVTWADKWPGICSYFGLEGAPPRESPYAVEEFVKKHSDTWRQMEEKHGLKRGIFDHFSWGFLYGVTVGRDFDCQYDLSKARSVGFEETVDTVKGYTTAFERMRQAKIIP
ncbi:uncharacterized protein LTR77_004356 [Saxophila tyrrhenica]|uniref:PRISE-like Rossmann-fold domain-containing protein n=1 Tax=Saxophila tyrrhenica TaxID=1690608 RepID=A0AAV9PCK3_9PEZI|nr:hypothetical protein LTR77_004356 [Saxophila tyrrhenica]